VVVRIPEPDYPQARKNEGSVGKKETKELAIMIDTFRPLAVAKAVLDAEDPSDARSWLG